MSSYTMKRVFPGGSFSDVLTRTREALTTNGFGIPTEMDTQAIFRQKLGKESPARVILGACLAPVAFEAMLQEPDIAALLPCNVVVRQDGSDVEVSAINPRVLFTLTEKVDPAHAAEVEAKLLAALDAIN
jgi:uncharacterized protein (DUF302 family)